MLACYTALAVAGVVLLLGAAGVLVMRAFLRGVADPEGLED